jgi:hypothetical protein
MYHVGEKLRYLCPSMPGELALGVGRNGGALRVGQGAFDSLC